VTCSAPSTPRMFFLVKTPLQCGAVRVSLWDAATTRAKPARGPAAMGSAHLPRWRKLFDQTFILGGSAEGLAAALFQRLTACIAAGSRLAWR